MPFRSLLPRASAAAALACGAVAFALAPAANAHYLEYDDPQESSFGSYGEDILQTTVDHWTESGTYNVRPPVTLEHTITTTRATRVSPKAPRLHIYVGSTSYEVYGWEVKRSDGTVTGAAELERSGNTWTYRFALRAIGNPSSYEWFARLRVCMWWWHYGWGDAVCGGWTPWDYAPDSGRHTHYIYSHLELTAGGAQRAWSAG
jgi:hypothetical protein